MYALHSEELVPRVALALVHARRAQQGKERVGISLPELQESRRPLKTGTLPRPRV
jgi:hypothetical protein